MIAGMQCCVARADGSLDVAPGVRPAARSGSRLVPLTASDVIPLPEAATIAHLPGRRALALTRSGESTTLGEEFVPVAAVLPVGHLRTLLPASEPQRGAPRLPLFGYAAIAEHRGELVVAAFRTDSLEWWEPQRFRRPDLPAAVDAARRALPGNRIVEQLSVCALEHNCYTAQNTFYRRYEAALPASPACNADWGEPLTRADALEEATARIRRMHPEATIHVNTNGSSPQALQRLIAAGCNSVRISAISFTDAVFRAYYRPIGYTLDDVVECGRVMRDSGGQVCLNLLTFPGITDAPDELERAVAACREMGVMQVQWRSLNVDHDWLVRVLPPMQPGMGMRAALERFRRELPAVEHGNFTRPHGAGAAGTPLITHQGAPRPPRPRG